MSLRSKILPFEYTLFKLVKWHNEVVNSKGNDLSTLKVLKLLFFTSAVNSTKDSEDTLLDKVFDNYVAMPYGHVESDVYNDIKQNSHSNISINNTSTTIINENKILELNSELKDIIDFNIESLKKINIDLVRLSSFDLVDLSHTWYSWQSNFEKARELGIYKYDIPVDEIKSEEKIYQI